MYPTDLECLRKDNIVDQLDIIHAIGSRWERQLHLGIPRNLAGHDYPPTPVVYGQPLAASGDQSVHSPALVLVERLVMPCK